MGVPLTLGRFWGRGTQDVSWNILIKGGPNIAPNDPEPPYSSGCVLLPSRARPRPSRLEIYLYLALYEYDTSI